MRTLLLTALAFVAAAAHATQAQTQARVSFDGERALAHVRRLAQNERAARRPAEKKTDAPGGGAGEGSPESPTN